MRPHLPRAAKRLDGVIQVSGLVVPAIHDSLVVPVLEVPIEARIVPICCVREVRLYVRAPGVLWDLVNA